MTYVLLGMTFVCGWAWCARRVALATRGHLSERSPDEVLELSDDLFAAVAPPPLYWLVDLVARRRSRRG